MKPNIKIKLSFLFCVSIFNCYLAIVATGTEDTGLAIFVLDKMIENRNQVENFKCIFEKRTYNSEKARQMFYKDFLEMDLPEEAQKALNEVYSYQKNRLALDNKGCGRVEMMTEEVDTNGNLTGQKVTKTIDTWDGKNSTYYNEDPGNIHAILGNEPSSSLKDSYNQPWGTFGGNLCDNLADAIKENRKVNVEKQNDGKYRIEFLHPEDSKTIGFIDPNQGYSVISQITYYQERLLGTYKARFEQVKPGIWFPVSGEYIHGSTAEPLTKITMTIKEVKINDPNFYEGLYHIDFMEGTRVRDNISGLRYVVGEPMSEKPDGASKSLHEVAIGTLEKMAEETNQKHQETEVFVPKAGVALNKGGPFVLGLSDGTLVNPRNKPESQESNKFLIELGRGDIAWDDKVVVVRGATALTTKQQASQPLKSTKGKWSISYELPEKVELPYSILVVTKENQTYLMNIIKIETNGIRITYRKLNPDEISIYKPETVDN